MHAMFLGNIPHVYIFFVRDINFSCYFYRYMGIGLSAQGVNMNRLPGMF